MKQSDRVKAIVSSADWYFLQRSIDTNINKRISSTKKSHDSKLHALTRNTALPFTASEVIQNISDYNLTKQEEEVLRYGLDFGIPPKSVSKSDIYATFECMNYHLQANLKDGGDASAVQASLSHLAHQYASNYKPTRHALKKHAILKKLKRNDSIVITRPDKGNSVVIMNSSDYHAEMNRILDDTSKFKKRDRLSGRAKNKDLTVFREEQLQRFLYSLKKSNCILEDIYKQVSPLGSVPSRVYGSPKMHKVKGQVKVPPLRPIVSSIGAYNYNLSKYLAGLVTPLISTEHSARDSFSFVDELKQLKLEEGNYVVSFDIVSLFTNIPLQESIDLAVELLFEKDTTIKMSKAQMKKLFHFATSQTHFTYQNQHYDQVDGVAMGSPLGPVLANLFMGKLEKDWLSGNHGNDHCPIFYRRYVDDIFCVLKSKNQVSTCLTELNNLHKNINFTVEEEENGRLPFLDILITRTVDMTFTTTTYCKPTSTGLLTNFTSFTAYAYKTGLIRTLTDRACKINSTVQALQHDLKRISDTLQKNMFPRNIINRVMSTTEEKHAQAPNNATETDTDTLTTDNNTRLTRRLDTRYFKLPYIGSYSRMVTGKISNLIHDFCKPETSIKLIYDTFKVGQYFSKKDKIPSDLSSYVVYKFQCASCNACYIGETTRHLRTRMDEHLTTDSNSHVFKHVNDEEVMCQLTNDYTCFSVVDRANSKYQLKIKEALAIKHHKPSLNRQVQSYKLKLLL